MTLRLRHVAKVNPSTPRFKRLRAEDQLTFMPLEAVWPDAWRGRTRVLRKDSVEQGYTRFQDGDVLLPKITPTFEANRSILVNNLLNGVGAGTTELHVLRPGSSIDPTFLLYVVRSETFLRLGEHEMYGVAGQKRLDNEFVLNHEVWLPALPEQRLLADFLEKESARVASARAAIQALRARLLERRESHIYELVTGARHLERRTSHVPWCGSLPSAWSEVKISYVARVGSGHTPSRSNPEWWVDCTIPWVTTGEVAGLRDDRREDISKTRECISFLGLANSSAELCPPETVVLCRTAASAGYSGVLAASMATSQDFVTWICGPDLDPYYLLWCLRAMRRDLLGRLAYGSTHRTIYFPDLQALRIPLPSLMEQREIVREIREHNRKIDELVDAIDSQDQLLNERRQALITAAVTGQVDVATARGVDI